MLNWKTRSLALIAAALLSGCSTTQNYYSDQYGSNPGYSNNAGPYDNNQGYSNQGYNDQYGADGNQYADSRYDPYGVDQYNDQSDVGVSFNVFHQRLAPYGTWSYNPRWGDVWRPRVGVGFRPYFNGYWANTSEYGWVWVSNDSWGDLTYHYGRWVFDPRDGWLWVPGYVWGPSWVVWRSGGGSIGWFPMPPDDYYGNGAYGGNFAGYYGYRDWYGPSFSNDTFLSLWIFVGEDRFGDRDFRNYVRPQREYNQIIVQTTDVTNYVTVNNYVINRSVNVERIERASNRRFAPVEARAVLKRDAIARPVAAGRQIEDRERRERPIPARAMNGQGQGGNNQAERLERREDRLERREDRVEDRQRALAPANDRLERREDRLDRREERVETRQNGNGPQADPRLERREDRLERREDRVDDRQRALAPVNDRLERREDRIERREERVETRQNGNGQNGNGQQQNAVQPANARRNEAAPTNAGASKQDERAADRAARQKEREERRDERRGENR